MEFRYIRKAVLVTCAWYPQSVTAATDLDWYTHGNTSVGEPSSIK